MRSIQYESQQCPTPLRRVFGPLFRDVERALDKIEEGRRVEAGNQAERLIQGGVRMMPKHHALNHLRLQAKRATPEEFRQDFRHGFAGHPLDVSEGAEINGKPVALNDLFVIEG